MFDTLGDSHGWRAGLGAAAALLGAALALVLGYHYYTYYTCYRRRHRRLDEGGVVWGRAGAAAALWLRGCGGFGRRRASETSGDRGTVVEARSADVGPRATEDVEMRSSHVGNKQWSDGSQPSTENPLTARLML